MREVEIDQERNVTVKIDSIVRIDIERITDVIEHRIAVEADLTVHELEFVNHGYCKAAYTKDGKLIEFITQHMACRLTHDNVVILRKAPEGG